MGYFTKRERNELNKVAEVEGEIRDIVRQRDDTGLEDQRVANRLASLIGQVAGNSIHQIDDVTAGLRTLRAQLEAQGERVQREVVQYASLSQSATESAKLIAEQLANWKRSAGRKTAEAESPSPNLVPSSDGA